MNLYEINSDKLQKHFVVADSYARAVELWSKDYGSEPENVTLVTPYIIVDPKGIYSREVSDE